MDPALLEALEEWANLILIAAIGIFLVSVAISILRRFLGGVDRAMATMTKEDPLW